MPDHISDIEIALTEACTNVLKHTDCSGGFFAMLMTVQERRCTIEIVDRGRGLGDSEEVTGGEISENGRGIMLMRALVDDVAFTMEPSVGMTVRLTKNLRLDHDKVANAKTRNDDVRKTKVSNAPKRSSRSSPFRY